MELTLFAAFAAGLLGSPHCVGMCGGFAVANAAGPRGALSFTLWSAGRITTYAALGALAGVVGQSLMWLGWVGLVVSAVMLFWLAARIAGLATASTWTARIAHGPLGRVMRLARGAGPYAMGLATGLLPCGLVYATLALPVVSASPVSGALAMAAFGVGTTPLLGALGAGALRFVRMGPGLRRATAAVVLLAGLWALQMRAPWRLEPAEAHAPANDAAVSAEPNPDDGAAPHAHGAHALPSAPCH